MDHVEHIIQGSEAHQQGDTAKALAHFNSAYQIAPKNPATIYYYANALFLSDDNQGAKDVLMPLLEMDEAQVTASVEPANPEILGYQIDGFYLMFHINLYLTEDWKASVKYAKEHLNRRQPGIESTWTKKAVQKELRELEKEWSE